MGNPSMDGVYAKLNHAKRHIEALRTSTHTTGVNGDTGRIVLDRQYDAEAQAVILTIPPFDAEYWGLLLGDALHNLRSALDHLAWQLAIRKYGSEPTDKKVIQDIQFPIVSDPAHWPNHRHRKHMLDADADVIAPFEPYNNPADQDHFPFWMLAHLSNIDKHRVIHPVYAAAIQGSFTNTGDYRDCLPRVEMQPDGSPAHWVLAGLQRLQPGDEVLRAFVTPVGPHPDVDFNASVTSQVVVNEQWPMMEALDVFVEEVEKVISRLDR